MFLYILIFSLHDNTNIGNRVCEHDNNLITSGIYAFFFSFLNMHENVEDEEVSKKVYVRSSFT